MNERARIEELSERYFAARTTEAEEAELRVWFRRAEPVPESLREVRAMFCGMDALAQEGLPAAPKLRLRRRLSGWWGVAAAAAIALGMLFGAGLVRKPYCYIDGVAIYDAQEAMQTTVYLRGFSELEEPVRIVDRLLGTE